MEKYRLESDWIVEISKKFRGFIVQNGEFFLIDREDCLKKDLI